MSPAAMRNGAVSASLHLAFLLALLHVPHLQVAPAKLPGTVLGSRISLTYLPGRARTETDRPAIKVAAAKLSQPARTQQRTQLSASAQSPNSAHPDAAQGGDALGSGNATVALATYFPTPKPDLSALPHGTRGDVIVDVVINEQGKIVQSEVAQSMGSGVDTSVLDTIQTWVFKPATRNGIAVPSEQQLLFHYERG